ncbi:MAG: hypothetical protein ACC655_11655, partial [Rhodothermia bacterium]
MSENKCIYRSFSRSQLGVWSRFRFGLKSADTFTALASLAAMERDLSDDAPVGYRTPSTVFGVDVVWGLTGS